MDEKRYTITLADGRKLENLRVNGDNFVSDTEVDAELFADNCSPLVVSDGEIEERHEHTELLQIAQYGSEYWIAIRDIPEDKLERIKMQSDIEYLAMMTDVEL